MGASVNLKNFDYFDFGKLKPKHRYVLIGLAVLFGLFLLSTCSSGASSDPQRFADLTCHDLVNDVIEMSQDEDVTVLEITDEDAIAGNDTFLNCKGKAIWSDDGPERISFNAEISPGGKIIVGYSRD